jgi:SAM-dependent methyltransferase
MNTSQTEFKTLERNFCILCGTKGELLYSSLPDKLFSAPGTWNEYKCSTCNLLFLNPHMDQAGTEMLYKTYYTHEGLTNEFLLDPARFFDSFPRNKKIKYAVLAGYFGYDIAVPSSYRTLGYFLGILSFFRKKIESSIGGFKHTKGARSQKRLLDLGSGNGDYLLEMKYLGYDVYGIEIDSHAAELSRKNGLSIITGELKEGIYEENFFDAIYLNNVIEHLHNPIETITLCHKLLKKDGELCIKTCSSESLAHMFFKESYRGLEIPRHFFVFSPKSLRRLASSIGFSIIKSYTMFNGYIWSASAAIKRGDRNAAYATSSRYVLLLEKLLVSVVTFFNKDKGDDIFILLRK